MGTQTTHGILVIGNPGKTYACHWNISRVTRSGTEVGYEETGFLDSPTIALQDVWVILL